MTPTPKRPLNAASPLKVAAAPTDPDATGVMRARRPGEGFRVRVPTLRVVAGRDMLSYVTLQEREEVVIGRDEAAGMMLSDALVSRRHAKVTIAEDQTIVIEDLHSTNGTSVNGVAVQRSIIQPGDHIEVGGVSIRLDLLSLDEIDHLADVVIRLKQQNRDPLTGLLTRAWLDDEVPALLERSLKAEKTTSCVFFDIDNFKSVNDRFGHQVGDEVLVGVARLMVLGVRGNDSCLRYGGEEIVMFCENADAAAAAEVAERVRKDIQGHEWHRTASGLTVTISAGVAQWHARESIRDWLERADAALYEAKRSGRNRVIVANHAG